MIDERVFFTTKHGDKRVTVKDLIRKKGHKGCLHGRTVWLELPDGSREAHQYDVYAVDFLSVPVFQGKQKIRREVRRLDRSQRARGSVYEHRFAL